MLSGGHLEGGPPEGERARGDGSRRETWTLLSGGGSGVGEWQRFSAVGWTLDPEGIPKWLWFIQRLSRS